MIGLPVLLFFMGSIFFSFELLVLLSTCFFMLPLPLTSCLTGGHSLLGTTAGGAGVS